MSPSKKKKTKKEKEREKFFNSYVALNIRHCAKHFTNINSFLPQQLHVLCSSKSYQDVEDIPFIFTFPLVFWQILLFFLCQVILLYVTTEFQISSRLCHQSFLFSLHEPSIGTSSSLKAITVHKHMTA